MKLLFSLLLIIPAISLRGWVILKLWDWFIVPLNAPQISIVQAIGISILINFMTLHDINTKKRDLEEEIKGYIFVFTYPFIILLIGWVTQLFL